MKNEFLKAFDGFCEYCGEFPTINETLRKITETIQKDFEPKEGDTMGEGCEKMKQAIEDFIANRITGAVDAIVKGGLKLI